MTIKQTLQIGLPIAMKKGSKDVVDIIRLLLNVINNKEKELQRPLTDAEESQLMQKQVKQRQESIDMFEKAGAIDKADQEIYERDFIKVLLPVQMKEDDIRASVEAYMLSFQNGEMREPTMKDMGKIIKDLKTLLASVADPALISKIVKEKLTP